MEMAATRGDWTRIHKRDRHSCDLTADNGRLPAEHGGGRGGSATSGRAGDGCDDKERNE